MLVNYSSSTVKGAFDIPKHRLLPLQRASAFFTVAAIAIEGLRKRLEIHRDLDNNKFSRACFCSNDKDRKHTRGQGKRELVAHLID